MGSVGELGLCGKCKHAHVREMKSEILVLCTELPSDSRWLRITSPVLRCRDFQDINQPSQWDLEKIAWVLNTDEKTKKIGFKPPQQEE